MVVTIGLSSAWQLVTRFDAFRLNAVNRARETSSGAAGKAVNVAIALHRLGVPQLAITLAGGTPGQQLVSDLQRMGLRYEAVETSTATRVCTTLIDDATGNVTELVENAPAVSTTELQVFRNRCQEPLARANVVVLSGSLPAGTPSSFYAELMQQTRAPVILDARGDELLAALPSRPTFVKPNREELAATLGRPLDSPAELRAAMTELRQRGARWAVVTDGAKAVWIAGKSGFYKIQPPDVDAINPIGSGDSLAAGIAWGLHDGQRSLEAVRRGVAAAVDNTHDLLPGRIDRQRVLAQLGPLRVE